jgi:hypothetical protein
LRKKSRIKQHWTVMEDEVAHEIEYACRPILGKMAVTIDGETFGLSSKFLFFGLARREAFRVGDTQALLVVGKNGRAQVLIKGKPIEEN